MRAAGSGPPRAIGKRRGDRFQADLGHFIDLDREHISRQAVTVTRQRVDQRGAVASSWSSRTGCVPPASR